MFKLAPLTVQVLAVIAAGAVGNVLADENPLELPAATISASPDTVEGPSQGYQAKPASTSTRLNMTARETPQGVTSVTREQLDDFHMDSIRDVLTATPGVNVQKVETDRTYFTARGFDINTFQYDGVGMPLTYGLLVGDVDTAPYQQIDIIHGANGLMSGTGNPSATVNFVRKRPTYTPEAQVSLSAGSWDKRRADLDVSGPLTESGNVRGRMIYANENGNSYLDRYSREKNIFSGELAFDLSERDILTLGFEDQKSNANGASWGALPLLDANGKPIHYGSTHSNISQPWVSWDVHVQRAFAEWTHDFDNEWQSKTTVTGVDHREDSQMFYMYSDATSPTGYTGLGSKYKGKYRELVGDLSLSGPFGLLGRQHEATFGASAARSNGDERSLYGSALYYMPVSLEDALHGNIPRPTYDIANDSDTADFTDRQKSLYAAARWTLADDLHLITGARMLSADSDGDNYGAPRDVRIHGKVTPYTGVVYDLTPEYSLYASYTEVFNPQYSLDSHARVLDPLEGKSYEAGIKGLLLDKKLNVSAAVFHTKQDNVAEYAGYDPSVGGSYYEGMSFRSEGLELTAAGEVAPGVELSGGYTYVYITDADHDRARLYIPRHQLTSALTYQLPMAPKVKVGGSLSWQSKTTTDASPEASQDAYALLGLMSRYDIDSHWSTQLNLNNLTNEKYLQSLRYDQSNFGDPRNFTASVTWKY